jgi:hypothetical protein
MGFVDSLTRGLSGGSASSFRALVVMLLVAFVVGQFNAWFYKWTHRGVSYSRTFTQALVLISMVAALTMSIVATNIFAAFGLLGGLAIIRYRTVIRDARDTAYIFLCLVCGMAAGFELYAVAAIGAFTANMVALYLDRCGFGAWHSLDSLLRFHIEARDLEGVGLSKLLGKYCRRVSLVSVDEAPVPDQPSRRSYQCTYKLRLRRPEWATDLLTDLKGVCGADTVHLLVEQEYEEVA